MWVLTFIYFYSGQPYVEAVNSYPNMMDCFAARQLLSKEVGRGLGYFKPGQQAICINTEENDD
jgi:hypothetical protein